MLMLIAASATAMQDGDRGCAKIEPIAAEVGQCADTPYGVVLAATADRAAALAAIAAQGEVRFARHFDRTPPLYALIEGDGAFDSAIGDALAAAGYVWRFPWLSAKAQSDGMAASVRRAVEARAKAEGATTQATEAMVTAALAQQQARQTPEAIDRRERGVVPHELGHGWYMRGWWPEPPKVAGATRQYGGPGPDWMDELAAVLMEDDVLTAERRSGFASRLEQGGSERERLLDLKKFLTTDHPMAGQSFTMPATVRSPRGTTPQAGAPVRISRVGVVSGDEARSLAASGLLFYLQSRLFADYLIERAGPSRAFVTAAETFASGGTTADWLARHGASLGIATDIDTLDADWREWVAPRSVSPTDG
ncbi:hypothetical protein [Sphingomonas sp. AX6]|uniref:hypothetical protein n=1 Tax=Sphingomonas sp. AX6 TaxID=2653171 RepID=UPI001357E291|nr:hypothetical protein [Sphingomonas sp. AX6]